MTVDIARVYDHSLSPGVRSFLIDRLWPRGLARQGAPFEQWLKDVAPTTELRKWYGHVPDRFEEFADRYRQELSRNPARDVLEHLQDLAATEKVILVTATKDVEHSAAAVLRDVLGG